MNMTKIAFPLAALIVGGALGYCLKPSPPAEKNQSVENERREEISPRPEDNSMRVLRARIRELEAKLAEKNPKAEEAEAVRADAPREEGRGGGNWRERIENFRRDNPEEFARMEKRRQEFRQHRAEQARSKLEFLSSIDVSRMNAKQKATHRRLQELVARRDELESKVTPDAMMNSSAEERREFFEEMRAIDRDMRELNAEERDILLSQAAQSLGLEGEDAKDVVSAIKEIYEHTGNDFGMRGFGGGNRRGGGRRR